MLWSSDAKNWLIWKDLDAGKDWGREEKTENEMVGWHHWLDGHEFEQTPGDGEGQGSLHVAVHGVTKSQTQLSDWIISSLLKAVVVMICFNRKINSFFVFIFNWRLVTLQYCIGFCHTLTWISHRCTCVPHFEPPSHLPPHPIPLGHPSAPALSTLSHASNLDWRSVSHMIIYIFQCYCKSSHPRLPPLSPKDCSIHLCLFCCLTYRVIVTIFLNSIYMC